MAMCVPISTAAVGATVGPCRREFRRRDIHTTMRQKTPARMRVPASLLSCAARASHDSSAGGGGGDERHGGESEPFSVLTSFSSRYNDIVVVDTPKARMLLLDSTHNVHSMLNKEQKWTGSYWNGVDERKNRHLLEEEARSLILDVTSFIRLQNKQGKDDFSSFPAIIPEGPVALLGLGGGTAAHLMLDLWPSLRIEGWEIDEILIDMAREYFGLSSLEKCTESGGLLSVRIGDAFSPSAMVQGQFAGIIVDLFADGKILPQLQEEATWVELEKRLIHNGRIMVNCGSSHSEVSGGGDSTGHSNVSLNSWELNATIKTMSRVFSGKLSWKRIRDEDSDNYLALTGPPPDLNAWSASLPSPLSFNVKQWRPCDFA